jgi:hypothetical protein
MTRQPPTEATRLEVVFDERLVEGAVLAAVAARPFEERHRFHREREAVYEVRDAEARDRAFRHLFARWFERWHLARPLRRALAEQPLLAGRTRGCLVGPALGPSDEGADLYGLGDEADQPPVIGIRIRPARLLDEAACLALLRHELQHVADMVDPAFLYQRDLPALDGGPAYENLVRQRYHLVWDLTIDGRLVHRGLAPEAVRAHRREEFARAFPALGPALDEVFVRWFDGPQPTHRAILDFVLSAATDPPSPARAPSTVVCPICRFPTALQAFVVDAIPPPVAELVARRHPAWRPAQGLCRQCVDLFEARLA